LLIVTAAVAAVVVGVVVWIRWPDSQGSEQVAGGAGRSTGGSGSTYVAGIPVLADAVSRPGAPLPQGLRVPSSSVLVGVPIPTGARGTYRGRIIPDHSWDAFLLVTGRPSEVVGSFLAQIDALGYTANLGTGCKRNGSTGTCLVGGALGPDNDRRYLILSITRGPAADLSRYPASLAVIHYDDRDPSPGDPPPIGPEPGPLDVRGADVPVPGRWAPLAGPGQVVGTGLYDTPAIRLPAGMVLAMPLMPYNCIAGQYRALIRVDGDPMSSFRSLRRQLLVVRR